MEKHGTHGNSGPGTSLKEIIEYIKRSATVN